MNLFNTDASTFTSHGESNGTWEWEIEGGGWRCSGLFWFGMVFFLAGLIMAATLWSGSLSDDTPEFFRWFFPWPFLLGGGAVLSVGGFIAFGRTRVRLRPGKEMEHVRQLGRFTSTRSLSGRRGNITCEGVVAYTQQNGNNHRVGYALQFKGDEESRKFKVGGSLDEDDLRDFYVEVSEALGSPVADPNHPLEQLFLESAKNSAASNLGTVNQKGFRLQPTRDGFTAEMRPAGAFSALMISTLFGVTACLLAYGIPDLLEQKVEWIGEMVRSMNSSKPPILFPVAFGTASVVGFATALFLLGHRYVICLSRETATASRDFFGIRWSHVEVARNQLARVEMKQSGTSNHSPRHTTRLEGKEDASRGLVLAYWRDQKQSAILTRHAEKWLG